MQTTYYLDPDEVETKETAKPIPKKGVQALSGAFLFQKCMGGFQWLKEFLHTKYISAEL